jgi:DNA repair protein RadC
MKTNRPYTESFLKGLKTLTGVSYRKLESYARDNNPLNVLEHPKALDVNDRQLKKIGLLKEIIASYNLLKSYEHEDKIKFTSPNQAANYFVPLLSGVKDKERFMVAFLDNGNNIIEAQIISEGTVSQTAVYPREVLKKALDCDCSSMILAHNHRMTRS